VEVRSICPLGFTPTARVGDVSHSWSRVCFTFGAGGHLDAIEQRFQIRPQDMPGRTYRGANKVPDTIRYFVDKFPLFLDSTLPGEPRVTLTFIDPGLGNLEAFKTHLDAYSSFLGRIPRFAFLFASPHARLFTPAERLFREATDPQPGRLSEQVARYFRLRADWEAKHYELLKDPDIEFMNHAKAALSARSRITRVPKHFL
jgi:hypothetical protein